MPIYIAKTFDGKIEDVVLAKNYELANVYWQGKGINAHHVDTRSDADLNGHPTGVLPIVSTRKVTASLFGKSPKEFLVID